MQIHTNLPLSITVTSYRPGHLGQTSGPPEVCHPGEPTEIEFEVHTLTGHELSESDFGEAAWNELSFEVLLAYEETIEESRTEARISAQEWYGA